MYISIEENQYNIKVQIEDNKRSKVNFYSSKCMVEHPSSNTFRLG